MLAIICTNENGHEFLAFTWSRGAEAGIARAYADARQHGVVITSARTIPADSAEAKYLMDETQSNSVLA